MSMQAMSNLIENLPKTETHLHMEGALPWCLLAKKYPERFSNIPDFRKEGFRYDNFEQFESILIDHAMQWFDSPNSYHEAAKIIFESHVRQNVKYVEISFHAGMIEFLSIPGEEILDAIIDAVPDGLEVRVFLGMSRNAYNSFLGPILDQALTWDKLSGIDLHGLESLPFESWTIPFWERARLEGKVVKAHAGEFGPASNVTQAVKDLNVRRIQHGTRSIDDEEVMKILVAEGVTLDMCPISNYKLRVVKSWKDHPLREFLSRGICCTVSTDDPLSFNNSLLDEYEAIKTKLGLTNQEIIQVVKNGFEVADLPLHKKDQYLAEIKHLVTESDFYNG